MGNALEKTSLTNSITFPSISTTNKEGLLYIGGELNACSILHAYTKGIFPWYQDIEGVHWYCPNPRFVLFPNDLKISKSMKRIIDKNEFSVTFNKCFKEVMFMCSEVNRIKHGGTWIDADFINCYSEIFKRGHGMSVEVWLDNKLIGGLYGVTIGKVFFGESMFSIVSNSSKYGFIHLVEKLKTEDFLLIDCQTYTKHLESLGGSFISRKKFLTILKENEKILLQ